MALSLGVKKGGVIKIGGVPLQVVSIDHQKSITVRINGREYVVSDKERVEILPTVFVFVGTWSVLNQSSQGRLAFEAPRAVRIERVPN